MSERPDPAHHAIPTLGKYQIMPPLSEHEFALLKADIATHGVLVPIELDDQGNILDGHNRLAAIAELEAATPDLTIPYDTSIRRNLTEEQKRDYVIALNLKRRHLSDEQRTALFIELRQSGHTLKDIANLAGSSEATVWRRIQESETTQPAYTMGRDGKLRPSTYNPAAYLSFKELQKEERGEQRAIDRSTTAPTAPALTDRYDIFQADIQHSYGPIDPAGPAPRILPRSLDAIICDPPYPQEYVHLMEDLGRFAEYALKPGRPLIALLGHAYLPEYITLLSKSLTYHWIMADVLGGANSTQHVWQTFVGWKPILVFTNGKAQLPYYFLDVVKSPGPDKEFHVWGQDVTTFELLTYRFTPPGPDTLVCDPFLGGGTTAIAALRQHRRFVGFDIDPIAVNTTLLRLSDPNVLTAPAHTLIQEEVSTDHAPSPDPAG